MARVLQARGTLHGRHPVPVAQEASESTAVTSPLTRPRSAAWSSGARRLARIYRPVAALLTATHPFLQGAARHVRSESVLACVPVRHPRASHPVLRCLAGRA